SIVGVSVSPFAPRKGPFAAGSRVPFAGAKGHDYSNASSFPRPTQNVHVAFRSAKGTLRRPRQPPFRGAKGDATAPATRRHGNGTGPACPGSLQVFTRFRWIVAGFL